MAGREIVIARQPAGPGEKTEKWRAGEMPGRFHRVGSAEGLKKHGPDETDLQC
jgi:hypothetical protein